MKRKQIELNNTAINTVKMNPVDGTFFTYILSHLPYHSSISNLYLYDVTDGTICLGIITFDNSTKFINVTIFDPESQWFTLTNHGGIYEMTAYYTVAECVYKCELLIDNTATTALKITETETVYGKQ